MHASPQSISFDEVEPHRYLPVNSRATIAGACELVLARPDDFADALKWLNEEYSEAAVAGRELQNSERTYKLRLWDLRYRRDRYETFPRRLALRAADPRTPEPRRLALLVTFYSVRDLAHLTPEFIVHLSKHPDAVRDWVVELTVEGLGGARLRDGQIVLSNDRREGDVAIDAANVETAWRFMDERCRETIQHIKAERQERDAKIPEQVKCRGYRLRRAVQDVVENGLPAGCEERKHARRVVLLACLLVYQHELPLAGEFASWQWESEGSMFAQLVGSVYVPGRESALFNPAYRRGERFDASCLNVPDFEGFSNLVGRAVRILQRANDVNQPPVTPPTDALQTMVIEDFRRLCRFMTALIVKEIPPEVQASTRVELGQGHDPTPEFMLWRETRLLAERCITYLAEARSALVRRGTLSPDRNSKLDDAQNALSDLIGSISHPELPNWTSAPCHSGRTGESELEKFNNEMAMLFDHARVAITRFTDWLTSVSSEFVTLDTAPSKIGPEWTVSANFETPITSKSMPQKSLTNSTSELVSWTQPDLDRAIRQYKTERAARYNHLYEAVRRNKPGAMNEAQRQYGRNAIARALKVKSKTMVSNSPVWLAIAKDLGFPLHRERHAQGTRRTQRPGRIGHDIAVEEKSGTPVEGSDHAPAYQLLETAERQETIYLINVMSRSGRNEQEQMDRQKAADDLIQRLQRGDCTDDKARQIVAMVLNS
jgi:hypothetical protein